jgi:hypothetical protein
VSQDWAAAKLPVRAAATPHRKKKRSFMDSPPWTLSDLYGAEATRGQSR